MKYKITEMNSNYQEVQVGTCELCFSTTTADVGALTLEDETGKTIDVPISVYNYDEYKHIGINNVVEFSAWLQEQDIPEITGDEYDAYNRLEELVSEYKDQAKFNTYIDDVEKQFRENFDFVNVDDGINFTYGPNDYRQNLKVKYGDYILTIPKQSQAHNEINGLYYGTEELENTLPKGLNLISHYKDFEWVLNDEYPTIFIDGDRYEISLGHFDKRNHIELDALQKRYYQPLDLVKAVQDANIHIYALESCIENGQFTPENFKTLEQAREDFQKQGLLNNLSDSLKDLENITLEK